MKKESSKKNRIKVNDELLDVMEEDRLENLAQELDSLETDTNSSDIDDVLNLRLAKEEFDDLLQDYVLAGIE